MAKKDAPAFRLGQLVMIVDDGTGPCRQPDFITGVEGFTIAHGWSYYIRGCSYPLAQCQIRRIKKKEIR
jgi:hypothetical protein